MALLCNGMALVLAEVVHRGARGIQIYVVTIDTVSGTCTRILSMV